MSSLLDTDILRYYLDDVPQAVELVGTLVSDGIALSIISYIELYQGTLQTPDPVQAQDRLEALLTIVPMLPLTPEVARRCARLREQLKRQGKRVRQGGLDLIIAATALEHNLTLVTRNRDDFRDIPDLKTHFYPAS